MTPTTSQAVRDARERLYRVDLERQFASQQVPGAGTDLNLESALDAFESAVRADEAAGLVDILARLVEAMPIGRHDECTHCEGLLAVYEPEFKWSEWYLAHTPDCPWVEGMNAVAERRAR